jgi:hypothetical protein
MNKRGQIAIPCGRPDVTQITWDLMPSITNFRSLRKSRIRFAFVGTLRDFPPLEISQERHVRLCPPGSRFLPARGSARGRGCGPRARLRALSGGHSVQWPRIAFPHARRCDWRGASGLYLIGGGDDETRLSILFYARRFIPVALPTPSVPEGAAVLGRGRAALPPTPPNGEPPPLLRSAPESPAPQRGLSTDALE